MITDELIAAVCALLGGLFSPAMPVLDSGFAGVAPGFEAAVSTLMPYFQIANAFEPVAEGMVIMGAFWAFKGARVSWFAVGWIFRWR